MAGKVSLTWNGILVLVLLISIIVLATILNYLYVQEDSNSSVSNQNAINQFLALGLIEKLPNCSQPTLVGNGVCNLELDIPECDFDGNDCATTITSTSTSTITTCPDWSKVSNSYKVFYKRISFRFTKKNHERKKSHIFTKKDKKKVN